MLKHTAKAAPSSKFKKNIQEVSLAPKPLRFKTKSAIILQMLDRKAGASIKELAAAAKWQDHSVRGFLSGTVKKKLGLDITWELVDGTRHYKFAKLVGKR